MHERALKVVKHVDSQEEIQETEIKMGLLFEKITRFRQMSQPVIARKNLILIVSFKCFKIILLILGMILLLAGFNQSVSFAEESKKPCFGFLWCHSEDQDQISTDAFFFLYSMEKRKGYERLAIRPFYSEEFDSVKRYTRRSVLWPLGNSEKQENDLYFWMVPFYFRHHNDKTDFDYQFVPLVYGSLSNPELSLNRFSAIGLPPIPGPISIQKYSLPTLSLYEHVTEKERFSDRFFPLYRYENQGHRSKSDLNILLLFNRTVTPERESDFLFPLFSYDHNQLAIKLELFDPWYKMLAVFGNLSNPESSFNWMLPIYGYRHEPELTEMTALGLPPVESLALAFFDYRLTPNGISNHLFPIYSYEHDLKSNRYDWSALVLYRHGEGPEGLKDALLPIYSYERNEPLNQGRFGMLVLPGFSFYQHQWDKNGTSDWLVPIYSYRHEAELTEMTALGLPAIRSIALALFDYRRTPDRMSNRFFPVYGYEHDLKSNYYDWNALLIYRHKEGPDGIRDAFLPIFSYQRNEALNQGRFGMLGLPGFSLYQHQWDKNGTSDWLVPIYGYRHEPELTEMTALGLPSIGSIALALFDYRQTPNEISNRFFPIYCYDHDLKTNHYNWNAFLLYRHDKGSDGVKDAFLPLYSYDRNKGLNQGRFGMLGLPGLSLYQHQWDKNGTSDWLVPIYGYRHEAELTEMTALGLPPAGSIAWAFFDYRHTLKETSNRFFPIYGYRHEEGLTEMTALGLPPTGSIAWALFDYRFTSGRISHRFFPIYGYEHDLKSSRYDWNVLLLYRHEEGVDGVQDTFLPLYNYERNEKNKDTYFGLIGISRYSLYHHLKSESVTEDRLFPLYGYSSSQSSHESELSILWPLADYKSEGEEKTEFNLLWWLIDFQKTKTSRSFRFLGGSAMALLIHERSDGNFRFEFNPVIPLYSLEKSAQEGSEWNILGGFVGYKKDLSGKGRMKLLWMRLSPSN